MIYRTRLVLFASVLAFPLTALSKPSPDGYRDDYRLYAANQALKNNPIYLPPEHISIKSCIYLQQENTTAASDYPLSEPTSMPYRFSWSDVSDSIPWTPDSSLSAGSCISNPREHIALVLNNSTGHSRSRDAPSLPENTKPLLPPDYSVSSTTGMSGPDRPANRSRRYADETWVDEDGLTHHHDTGEGFEHWHNSYESGTLGEADFYAFYYVSDDTSSNEIMGMRLVYGTYAPLTKEINGGIIHSATSVSGEVFIKRYDEEILFVSPFVLFSLGYGDMWWNYQRPIITNSGTKIEGEAIEFFQLRAGIGLEIGRFGMVQLSAFSGADARIYRWQNYEEFYNPLFKNSVAMTWGVALGMRF